MVSNSSQSAVTYTSRKHNCVTELLQPYRCTYVQSMMVVTAVLFSMELTQTLVNLITHADEDDDADANVHT